MPVSPAPGPLEAFAHHFDSLFSQRSQRQAFRDYLAGLLLPAERNKTLTALANTEPIVGAHAAPAQRLQWFLAESTWDAEVVNRCRLAALRTRPTTAPNANGALVIDETGDRKDGERRRTSGGSIGKIDNGGVSVGALWADERVYYPGEECDAPRPKRMRVGGNGARIAAPANLMAGSVMQRPGMAGTMDAAGTLLAGMERSAPSPALRRLFDWLWEGRPIDCYAR